MTVGTVMSVFLVLLVGCCVIVSSAQPAYDTCCTYCRGNQGSWLSSANPWNISFEQFLVTDFTAPASFSINEQSQVQPVLYGRQYSLEYGGIPLYMTLNQLSPLNDVMDKQYIQIDLTDTRDVQGVIIQAGFVRDVDSDLFEVTQTWVTRFLASQSLDGVTFTYIGGTGAQVFSGNTDVISAVNVPFPATAKARFIRIHPLEARDYYGPVSKAIIRAAPVVCTNQPDVCVYEPLDCMMTSWRTWGSCVCAVAGCFQERTRDVIRHRNCGGKECDTKLERKHCVQPEPVWKVAVGVIFGIIIAIIIVVIVVILILKFKKTKDNKIAFRKGTATGKRNRAATAKPKSERSDSTMLADADEGAAMTTPPNTLKKDNVPVTEHARQPDVQANRDKAAVVSEKAEKSNSDRSILRTDNKDQVKTTPRMGQNYDDNKSTPRMGQNYEDNKSTPMMGQNYEDNKSTPRMGQNYEDNMSTPRMGQNRDEIRASPRFGQQPDAAPMNDYNKMSTYPQKLGAATILSGEPNMKPQSKMLAPLPSVNEPPSPETMQRRRLLPEREELHQPRLPAMQTKPQPKDDIDMLYDELDDDDLGW